MLFRSPDIGTGARTVGSVRMPKGFNARVPASRRDLAAILRVAVADLEPPQRGPSRRSRPTAAQDDEQIATLRRRLRQHPCHSCPDRDEHARWAERWSRLKSEHDALLGRITGRTGSIAAVFDRICDVLVKLGYLETDGDRKSVV